MSVLPNIPHEYLSPKSFKTLRDHNSHAINIQLLFHRLSPIVARYPSHDCFIKLPRSSPRFHSSSRKLGKPATKKKSSERSNEERGKVAGPSGSNLWLQLEGWLIVCKRRKAARPNEFDAVRWPATVHAGNKVVKLSNLLDRGRQYLKLSNYPSKIQITRTCTETEICSTGRASFRWPARLHEQMECALLFVKPPLTRKYTSESSGAARNLLYTISSRYIYREIC